MGIDTLLKAAPPRYTAQVASWADKIDQMRSIGWSWGDIAAALAPDLGWVLPGVDQSAQARVLGERLRISMRGARAAIAVGKLKPEQPKTTAAPDAEPQRPGVVLSKTMESESSEYLAEQIRQKADDTLTRSLQDPQRLSPAALVRVLSPVIEKHLSVGLTLEDIAAALRDDGFAIKRTHLARHLSIIRAENGATK